MGGKKIDWIKIRNDYINGRGSYRKLADKYGVSLSTLKDKAAREEWVRQREEHQTRIRTKADRKTADKIAEREASRVARLLETTDKLQEALERAADELDRQTVRNKGADEKGALRRRADAGERKDNGGGCARGGAG